MIKLSDHIYWTAKPSEVSERICHHLTLSIPSAICFSLIIALLLLYVFLVEKNHAVGKHAFNKVISWSGVTLVAFATASLAALDVALFVACHHTNHVKAIFRDKVFHPVILPAVNRAIEIYDTAYNYVAQSPNVARSYLRELVKNEKKLHRASDFFCAIFVAAFIVLSLYLQLSFSGLLSQDDLRHVFGTYFISISTFSGLIYGFCLHHAVIIPGYVLDYLRQTAGAYWNHLAVMANLDSSSSSIPEIANDDILLHLGEEMPDLEELLTLYLRSQVGFDFHNQDDLIALFGSLSDDLSLKLPELIDTDSVTIVPLECIIFYSGIMGRGCRIEFDVMKEQRTIGYFDLSFVFSTDEDIDLTTEGQTMSGSQSRVSIHG
ncbi:hypothetical protein KCU91_g2751, partial [Aureobasidium melanogenum]